MTFRKILYIDLDGTLIHTDTLWESALLHWKLTIFAPLLWIFWLRKGKSYLKHNIAENAIPDASVLPYNNEVISVINNHKSNGGLVYLATAANHKVAQTIADYLGIFDGVLASSPHHNLSRHNKADELLRHAHGEFDYIGNSSDDIPVWEKSGRIALVGKKSLIPSSHSHIPIIFHADNSVSSFHAIIKALRVYQWVKNLLLFLPLILAHRFGDIPLFIQGVIAFFCFSFCASSIYILNDLLDIENDRHHIRKKNRPFAAGILSIPLGLVLIPLLLATAFFSALHYLPIGFVFALLCYLIVTVSYSFGLKKTPVLDVIILAGLYTFRVLSGGIGLNIRISPWLLMLSIFLFLSLAFVKRYAEIISMEKKEQHQAKGRGYRTEDKPILGMTGVASGIVSVLVFVQYLRSNEVVHLYHNSHLLWLVPPLFLYWIAHVWFIANRNQMHDDPIIFAAKDKTSYLVFGIISIIILLAMSHLNFPRPW